MQCNRAFAATADNLYYSARYCTSDVQRAERASIYCTCDPYLTERTPTYVRPTPIMLHVRQDASTVKRRPLSATANADTVMQRRTVALRRRQNIYAATLTLLRRKL